MASVSEISSRYVDEIAALDPVRGERWGVATDGTRLTDYSPAGYDRRKSTRLNSSHIQKSRMPSSA